MKAILLLACMALFTGITFGEEVEPIDFSEETLKHLKIEDIDFNQLNVTEEIKKPPLENPQMSTAVVFKIMQSINHYNPVELKEGKVSHPKIIVYKWKYASKQEIQLSKAYLKAVAQSHNSEEVRMYAYGCLGDAFYEQKGVLLWLLEELYKPIPENEDADLRATVINAIIVISGEKYKIERNTAVKSWLGHSALRQRYNALKVLYWLQLVKGNNYSDLKNELLPDIIACFTTSSESSKVNKMLALLLNEYDVLDLVEYYDIMKQAYKNTSGWSRMDKIFEKIEKELNTP